MTRRLLLIFWLSYVAMDLTTGSNEGRKGKKNKAKGQRKIKAGEEEEIRGTREGSFCYERLPQNSLKRKKKQESEKVNKKEERE